MFKILMSKTIFGIWDFGFVWDLMLWNWDFL